VTTRARFIGGLVVIVGLVAPAALARPGAGRAGGHPAGGMARPAGGMARPATPAARPNMQAPRPQMPQARPQLPQGRPAVPQARPQMPQARPAMPSMPNVSRPQPMQRPSLGGIQQPGMNRPAMPTPTTRPAAPSAGSRPPLPNGIARPSMPSVAPRPGIGSLRPSPSTRPAPSPGLSLPGGGRPGGIAGPATRPTFPQPSPGIPTTKPAPQPGLGGGGQLGGGRPGLGGGGQSGGERPGLGAVQRPTTLPGLLPGGNLPGNGGGRPGIGGNRPGLGGNRPGIGGNRPGVGDLTGGVTTLPGTLDTNRPGLGGNRPGIGGNRPGFGGNRPGIDGNRPGFGGNRPGIEGNRPGFGGNRPGIAGNRPEFGGNRPGIGDGNTFWNSGNINSGNLSNTINNVNVNRPWGGGGWAGAGWGGGGWGYPGSGGGWGYPGYGGGWAGAWNGGCVNPHYGWYNGCWSGNWWAPFAAGAATWGLASTVANWGLGYGAWGYSTAYANPYYSAIPATVVATSPYDYAQPVAVTTYAAPVDTGVVAAGNAGVAPAPAPADTVTEAERTFDEALTRFKAGDYTAALAACDRVVKLSPKDPIVHEVRALALFALARYPEAAATLNAVLAAAPGMDWTTMSGLYGSVDTYTAQLRKLEEFCRTRPDDAAAWFVLGYHYLVGGHTDMAADALRVVVAKQPGDVVAKQLLASIAPEPAATTPAPTAEATPAAAAAPETDLVGTWVATAGGDTVTLTIKDDSTFAWKAAPQGRPAVEITGTIETARDAIAMVSETAGTMGGTVVSKGPDAFEFTLAGGPPGAKPLLFKRQ